MNKFIRVGLGLLAGVAAGIAVYEIIKRQRATYEAASPYAEAAESSED